jgi:hypothetical protein
MTRPLGLAVAVAMATAGAACVMTRSPGAPPLARPVSSGKADNRAHPWAVGNRIGKTTARAGSRARRPAATQAADLVAASLEDRGLRFGTDGSVAALWGYLRSSHEVVAPTDARAGDVLFFETAARPAGACSAPDHTGIVTEAQPDGRLGFVEARDGRVRRSFVDPLRPGLRRDQEGRIRNTFLRPKRPDDPPGLPLFAGEMLCAVARISRS